MAIISNKALWDAMSCESSIFCSSSHFLLSFSVMTGAEINILGVGVDSALLIAISLVICTCLLLGNTYMYDKNKIFI